jgi:phage-related protein
MTSPIGSTFVEVRADTRDFDRQVVSGVDRTATTAGSKISGALKAAFTVTGVIAAAGAVGGLLKSSVEEAREAQKVGALTEQIIKSTGGAAKVTAGQVGDLAGALSRKTGIDDELIQSGANLLLTFKNVKNEVGDGANIFDRATAAALDLSAAGFGDLSGTSKQLGKALNDPIAGITALSRAGVTFTDQQKEQIKTLVESGDVLSAQKIILAEVESQVGGAAAASATAGEKAAVAFGNLKETIGTALLPLIDKAAVLFADRLVPGLLDIGGAVAETVGPALRTVVDVVREFVTAFQTGEVSTGGFIGQVQNLGSILGQVVLPAVQNVLSAVRDALVPVFQQVGAFIGDNLTPILTVLGGALGGLLLAAVVGIAGAVGGLLVGALVAVVGALTGPIALVGALAAAFIYAYTNVEGFRKVVDAVVGAVVPFVIEQFGRLRAYVDQVWPAIRESISNAISVARQVIDTTLAAIQALWERYGNAIRTVVTAVFNGIRETISNVLQVIRGVIDVALGVLTGNWSRAFDGIKAITGAVFDQIRNIVSTALGVLQGLLQAGLATISGLFDAAWAAVKALVSAALDAVKGAVSGALGAVRGSVQSNLDAVRGTFQAVFDAVSSIVRSVLGALSGIAGDLLGGLRRAIEGGLSAVGGLFSAAFGAARNAVAGGINDVASLAGGIGGRIRSAVGDLGGLLVGAGGDLLRGLARGIGGAIGGVVEAAKNAARAAVNAVKGALGIRSPSTVFTALGEQTGAGLAVGLDRSREPVRRSAQDLLDVAGLSLAGPGFVQGRLAATAAGAPVEAAPIQPAASAPTLVINGNVGWDPDEVARRITARQRDAAAVHGLSGILP